MPLLKNCCYCIPLSTGGVLLGIFALVSSSFIFVVAGINLVAILHSNNSRDTTAADDVPWVWMALYAGLCIICIISSIMLIVGSLKRRKNFLIPYLVIDGLRCIFTGAYIPMMIHTVIMAERKYRKGPMQLMYGTIFLFAVQVYLWVCIYSLYQKIREDLNRPRHVQLYGQQPAHNPHVTYSYVSPK